MNYVDIVRRAVLALLAQQEYFTFRDLFLKVDAMVPEGEPSLARNTVRCYCYRFCTNKYVRRFYAPSAPDDDITYWCEKVQGYRVYKPKSDPAPLYVVAGLEECSVDIGPRNLPAAVISSVSRENLIASIELSCEAAVELFLQSSVSYSRKDFDRRGALAKHDSGVVYMYLAEASDGGDGGALYIGVTSRSPRARLHDQTSPHIATDWWKDWKTFRCLDVSNETDRLTLELLLILAYSPEFNIRPGGRDFPDMFPMAA